jgi:hypothetical protein
MIAAMQCANGTSSRTLFDDERTSPAAVDPASSPIDGVRLVRVPLPPDDVVDDDDVSATRGEQRNE